jgi:hypothetical protein
MATFQRRRPKSAHWQSLLWSQAAHVSLGRRARSRRSSPQHLLAGSDFPIRWRSYRLACSEHHFPSHNRNASLDIGAADEHHAFRCAQDYMNAAGVPEYLRHRAIGYYMQKFPEQKIFDAEKILADLPEDLSKRPNYETAFLPWQSCHSRHPNSPSLCVTGPLHISAQAGRSSTSYIAPCWSRYDLSSVCCSKEQIARRARIAYPVGNAPRLQSPSSITASYLSAPCHQRAGCMCRSRCLPHATRFAEIRQAPLSS